MLRVTASDNNSMTALYLTIFLVVRLRHIPCNSVNSPSGVKSAQAVEDKFHVLQQAVEP